MGRVSGTGVEMQSPGPAARSGPKFGPGRAFCGARTTNAGLMLGSRKTITMYYALTAGLRAVLEDAGRARCWAQQITRAAGLGSGLAFGEIFAPLHWGSLHAIGFFNTRRGITLRSVRAPFTSPLAAAPRRGLKAGAGDRVDGTGSALQHSHGDACFRTLVSMQACPPP